MDNTEQNKVSIYDFGPRKLNLDDYIYNLEDNLSNYVNSRTSWTDDQRKEFLNAYDSYISGLQDLLNTGNVRFSTNASGAIVDRTGLLSDKDNDGIDDNGSEYYYNDNGDRITTDDFNKLKKRKLKKFNTFSANREVASYFNWIGKAMPQINDTKKENSDNKFDLSKHGYIAYWQRKNNPLGGKTNLKPYLDMDKYDPNTGKRARTNRANYIALDLLEYLKQLKSYDYNGTNFDSEDSYKKSLSNAAKHLADGTWDNNDIIALNLAGIGGDFLTAFFSEEENPDISEDLRKLIEEKEKKEKEEELKVEQKEAYNKWIDDLLGIFDKNQYKWTKYNPYLLGKLDSKYLNEDGSFNSLAFRDSFKLDPNADNSQFFRNYFDSYLANPFSKEGSKALAGLIGMGYAQKLDNGYYYIPQTERDRRTNSGLIYDPITGKLLYTFIGDIASEWDQMNLQYKEMNGLINRRDLYSRFKEGGVINKYQIGGGFDPDAWMAEDKANVLSKQGKKNTWNTSWHSGRDAELEAAGNRKTFADPTMENPDNGFNKTDLLRLGTIAADIVSMGAAFAPGVGTAVSAVTGVGSSIGTFFADAFEDGLDWGDVKNLGANLGMDALGLIPGGGAASKGAKIAKNLGKYATRVIAAVGAAHTIANGDKIIGSYNKLLTNPSELSVDDWRNISAGLGLVTGGVAAGTRKYLKAKAEAVNAKPDSVAVEFIDKNTGKKHTLAFTGDDAKNIRKAQESGNFEDLRKATTGKYEKLRNLDIANDGGILLRSPILGWKFWKPLKPWTTKEKGAHIYDIYSDSNGIYAKKGKWEADEYLLGITSDKSGKGLKKSTLLSEIDTQIKLKLDALLNPLVERSKKIETKVNKYKEDLPNLELKLKTDKGDSFIPSSELIKRRKAILDESDFITSNDLKTKLTTKNKIDSDLITALLTLDLKKQLFANLDVKAKDPKVVLTAEEHKTYKDLQNEIPNLELQVKTLSDAKTKFETDNAEWDTWQERVNKNDADLAGMGDLEKLLLETKELERRSANINNLRKWLKDAEEGKIHSREYLDFLRKYVTGTGDDQIITFNNPSKFRDQIQKSFKDLLKEKGIIYKKGGNLNLLNVRKFLKAGKITNTSSTANWFSDMFQSKQMLDWLNTFNLNNYENFNNLLKSWNTNLINSGYEQGASTVTKNQGVWDRLEQWNTTGTNLVISDLVSNGKIKTVGNSGDNAENNYLDGFFGELEFLRHGGTRDSWVGHEQELKDFQNQLATKGLTYILDPNTDMYLLAPIKNNVDPLNLQVTNPQNTLTNPSISKDKILNIVNNDNNSLISSFNIPATFKYGIPRAIIADRINRRITNMAIDSEKPYYQDPFLKSRNIRSDLNKEISGLNAAGMLYGLADKAITSDGDKQMAAKLESAVKGQDFINLGKEKSDEIYRQYEELAKLEDDFSAKNRHDVAMLNRLSAMLTQSNKSKIRQAYLSKKFNIYDTLALLLEKEAKDKELEKAYLIDNFAQSDIHNAVQNDLKSYVPDLTPDEESIWNQVLTGAVQVSELSNDPIKYNNYLSAWKKASLAEQEQLRIYKNIPKTLWSGVRYLANEQPLKPRIRNAKKGASLSAALVRAKTEDAKLFQKSIKESIDRNEKILDRVSKSLYSYIKASIVK